MYLDSARLDDLRTAAGLGFLTGLTMNPLLLQRAGVEAARRHLAEVVRQAPEIPIFYQPCSEDPDTFLAQAHEAVTVAPDQVVIKIMALKRFFAVARSLTDSGIRCAMTGVYSPAQALAAGDAGCTCVIPYVDRAARLLPDGSTLVRDIRAVLDRVGGKTSLLAASVKSPQQAVQAIRDGADEVSVPLEVLLALTEHPLTESAAEGFAAAAATIRW